MQSHNDDDKKVHVMEMDISMDEAQRLSPKYTAMSRLHKGVFFTVLLSLAVGPLICAVVMPGVAYGALIASTLLSVGFLFQLRYASGELASWMNRAEYAKAVLNFVLDELKNKLDQDKVVVREDTKPTVH